MSNSLATRLRRFAMTVADRDDPDTRQGLESWKVSRTRDLPSPDDSDANLTRIHRSPHSQMR